MTSTSVKVICADFGQIRTYNNNKARIFAGFAVRTRLELATYGVTGRYSNQLNYRTRGFVKDHSFSKAGAKVLLFFEMTKYFCIFFEKMCFFRHFSWCIAVFLVPLHVEKERELEICV